MMTQKMRRSERQITDQGRILDILDRAEVLRLALAEDGEPYVVTLNYGFKDGCLFIHSAPKGRKIRMIKANPKVCFTVDVDMEMVKAEEACKWGFKYRSIIGFGRATVIEDLEEKKKGLAVLMAHYDDKAYSFPDEGAKAISIIKIEIEEMTAKAAGW